MMRGNALDFISFRIKCMLFDFFKAKKIKGITSINLSAELSLYTQIPLSLSLLSIL